MMNNVLLKLFLFRHLKYELKVDKVSECVGSRLMCRKVSKSVGKFNLKQNHDIHDIPRTKTQAVPSV